jgi:hypothetical protein
LGDPIPSGGSTFFIKKFRSNPKADVCLCVGFFTPAIPNMSMELLRVNSSLWQRLQIYPHQSLRIEFAGSRGPKNALTCGACRFVS